MKLGFTGGGTGGHFYPLMAVAEKINTIKLEESLHNVKLYYFGDTPYNEKELLRNDIKFVKTYSSRMPTKFSWKFLVGAVKLIIGQIKTFFRVFSVYPDVIFSKGGYPAFTVVISAALLKIPILVHETDSVPGRINLITGRFAKYIAISFPDTYKYFEKYKKRAEIVLTGQPMRSEVTRPRKEGAKEFLRIYDSAPVIVVLGGSQGASAINDVIVSALPELVRKYHVIHQVGKANYEAIKQDSESALSGNKFSDRYHIYDFLSPFAMASVAGVASLVISRAGGTIFEIASWGVPSILVPLPNSHKDHQKQNAYIYASTGSAIVIEEDNLTKNILIREIEVVLENEDIAKKMSESALAFAKTDGAEKIARKMLQVGIDHQGK